ncbi:MAG TPA: AraC family transcriptional regulator [Fimbriimonadaceae bacterium]|nr:AraC family transcriptional regulator [Fimbriimonadaceae bacterium]HRJ31927.1 AraC family transcriptional regulator [Fimbriimonadaceae bacterium]
MVTVFQPAEFSRSETTPIWKPSQVKPNLPITGGAAWQSGSKLRDPASGSPQNSLDVQLPSSVGELRRVHVIGVFAMFRQGKAESSGSVGAAIQVLNEEDLVYQHNLVSGRHYGPGSPPSQGTSYIGDGTSIEVLDSVMVDGREQPVCHLTLDLPPIRQATHLRFRDFGTPASFLIYDVIVEQLAPSTCPFRGNTGNVALSEVGSIVRLGDRARFDKATRQLIQGVKACGQDLDEAKSLALTFLAVVSAALLESGAPRSLHRLQLRAIRLFDEQLTSEMIAQATKTLLDEITGHVMVPTSGKIDPMMERTFSYLARNYSKNLTDADVAKQFGLSTSHFRFLFREAAGKPFHKYLIALRLERARLMILQENTPISEISARVGFSNAAHFSRIFQKEFSVTPSKLRANRRKI